MKATVCLTVFLILTAAVATAEAPRFVEKPCTGELAQSPARCGTVSVPESAASGRMIALNVVVVPAAKKPAGIPLFHFEGGPGVAATDAAGFYVGPGAMYCATRDVVLIDDRGTGASNPLRCPSLEHRSHLQNIYTDASGTKVPDVEACRDALAKIADLTAYSTPQIASDFDAVRQALGYDQFDIWALSYGTRLAQEYIRRFPSRVAHAVLVGFVPADYRTPLFHAANAQRALDLLFYKCQIDAACSAKYPNLRSDWTQVQERVRHGVTVKRGGSTVTITAGPFGEAVRDLMGVAVQQRQLPSLIHQAAAGDFGPFVDALPKDSSQFADGLYLSIACSEGAARIRAGEVEQYTAGTFVGAWRAREELAACAVWPRHALDDGFFEPVKSAPPTLVIAGEMDHVATPDWGRQFCDSLPTCRFVLVPDMGHAPFDLDAWANGSCLDEIMAGFYRNPAALDVSCLRTMRPPAFR